ncbi:GNAT family N-acetyltransferase [Flavobacterium urocaniciphilum]|uniref:Ribosomal protein S18 acetylase RimI n=1 Tax=Flavobacterium urocaniciphilum TaxID=1299341 RepID=A0A1H9AY25_9FLAO|nr:GNAT family N-acetyltransferase [Flavobacterium urocaniciphilum]SEP81425.1 Ribosomal protein S18 acetylase RimI [Flavobacterium urocaniciphilum]
MLQLRKIEKDELSIIKDLAYEIWPDTYKEILSEEQLNYMLEKFYSIDNLESQMNNGQIFELLFEESQILGFVAYEFNCNQSDKLKIHKIYLLPGTQGKGFGKFMIDQIISGAKNNNQKGIFLNVNKYNKAKFFYEKIGFIIVKDEVIDIGNNYVMDDYVMEYVFK